MTDAYKTFQCNAFQNNAFQIGYSTEVSTGCPACGSKIGIDLKWKNKRSWRVKGKFEDTNKYVTCWNCGFICEVK